MEPYQGVFKRIEKKYRVAPSQRTAVEAAAHRDGAMDIDEHGRTRITSLYLDTPHRAIIARSVEKPLYKEKLRLRAYGRSTGAALVAAFGPGAPMRVPGQLPPSDELVRERAAAGCAAALAVAVEEDAAIGSVAPDGGGTKRVGGARMEQFGGTAALGSPAPSAPLDPLDPCALTVFFGIKKKFKGIVYKRRLVLSLPAAVAFVGGCSYEVAVSRWPSADPALAAGALAPGTRQIARELEAAMDRWVPLGPSMGIACDREAWAVVVEGAPGDPQAAGASNGPGALDPSAVDSLRVAGAELRLTFDNRLEYLDRGAASADWRSIIDPDESILEIKSAGPYPAWLVAALSDAAIYPTSFTKYGRAYQLAEGTALQRSAAVG